MQLVRKPAGQLPKASPPHWWPSYTSYVFEQGPGQLPPQASGVDIGARGMLWVSAEAELGLASMRKAGIAMANPPIIRPKNTRRVLFAA